MGCGWWIEGLEEQEKLVLARQRQRFRHVVPSGDPAGRDGRGGLRGLATTRRRSICLRGAQRRSEAAASTQS
jgi:hypothetical protein